MARWCPELNRKVLYLDCQECEEKTCRTSGVTDYETPEDALHQECRSAGRNNTANGSLRDQTDAPYRTYDSTKKYGLFFNETSIRGQIEKKAEREAIAKARAIAAEREREAEVVRMQEKKLQGGVFFEPSFHFVTGQPPKKEKPRKRKRTK